MCRIASVSNTVDVECQSYVPPLAVDEDLVMVLEGAAALGSVCGVCVDVLHGAGSVRAMRSVAAEVQGACRGLSQLWAAAERAREAAEAGDLLAKAAHATVR